MSEDFSKYLEIYRLLKKQGYHIVGRHSAVKKCHWLHEAIVNRRFCYKCKFYGIRSHRCLQMTPALVWCWHRCLHCWRAQPTDIGIEWREVKLPWCDDPEYIVEESIKEQRRIVSGYLGNPKADKKLAEEALEPKHVAISLAGEPTLYPRLGELIEEYHKRGFTTFLVTNGTRPDVLANIVEPSQLYVSINMPIEEKYIEFSRPLLPNTWKLILKTLELLPSFSCPTVIRITLVKGYNDKYVKEFAKLLEKSHPTYIEVKAYMHVGFSTYRLTRENMPSHEEVKEFAKKLAEEMSYKIIDEDEKSRVVLLSSLDKPIRVGDLAYQ